MKKKRLLWLIPAILLLAVLVWAGVFYFILRGRSITSKPLVLITSPLNGQRVEIGKGVTIQAVARVDKGVQRMQVWVDDALVDEKTVTGNDINSPLGIITNWIPPIAGRHVVSIRAFSANGVSGQSTVFVMAEEQTPARHVVQEGETLEVIAASYGVEEEVIAEANEGAGTTAPQTGDILEIPASGGGYSPPFDDWGGTGTQQGEDSPGATSPAGESGEDTPPGIPPEPGSDDPLNLFFFAEVLQTTDPIELVVEVQAMQTRESYASVHCYVSLAGSIPSWVPDADYDQSTDESFESRDEGTEWNVARYMADTGSTRITWDRNTPVPIDISCVGIQQDGLTSVDLGRITEEVSHDQWGIPQTARSSGGESQFNLAYLVTYPEKGLDPAMTAPWNVRLHEADSTLSWLYLEDVEGTPGVDGFAVFLNDQLQFTVDGGTREVELPPQWFDVPCNNTFLFTVVAFFDAYPDGDYSPPSDPAVLTGGEPGSEGCPLSVTITFQVLNVGNLGNPIPITAFFTANEQRLALDGFNGVFVPEVDVYGIPRPELYVNEDSTPPTLGLEDNHGYRIGSLFEATTSRYGQLVLELPYDDPENPYDSLQLGFEISGPDNRLLCGGDLAVSAEDARQGIFTDIFNEYPNEGIPNLCIVSLNLAPIIEGASDEPLPDMKVEGISYDSTHGFHVIHLHNTGQADWANQDLVIEATTPEGDLIDRYTFRNATLGVNEHGQLGDAQFRWEPIMGACVELDPDNLVREEIDRVIERGILSHRGRYCPLLPDLTITGAQLFRDAGVLNINISNYGENSGTDSDFEGGVQNRDLLLRIETVSGVTMERTFPGFSMGVVETTILGWPMNESERAALAGGYTIMVNADQSILETDPDNNSYIVEGSTMIRIAWRGVYVRFCSTAYQWWGDFDNKWTFVFWSNIKAGHESRSIASWGTPEIQIDVDDHIALQCINDNVSDWIEVFGDEEIEVNISGTMKMAGKSDRHVSASAEHLSVSNNFGGAVVIPMDMDPSWYNHQVYLNRFGYPEGCGVGDVGREHTYGPDPFVWADGMHRWGPFLVPDTYGDGYGDRDPCNWSSTFMIYRAEEP